jgi:predicted DNA-binding protein
MTTTTREVILRLPARSHHCLEEWAQRVGKTPALLTQEIVEEALQAQTSSIAPASDTARQILQAAGRIRSLSPALRHRIIPGVSLEEVQASLARAGGQSLSEIILEQRGPKP